MRNQWFWLSKPNRIQNNGSIFCIGKDMEDLLILASEVFEPKIGLVDDDTEVLDYNLDLICHLQEKR